MAEDTNYVGLTSQLSDFADQATRLEKALKSVQQAGQGVGTNLPHNFRKAASAVDQLISRIRQLETAQNRLSTSGGAVGAARISAAHATLTGLGRGGGGYSSSGGGVPAYPRLPMAFGGGGGGSTTSLLPRGGGSVGKKVLEFFKNLFSRGVQKAGGILASMPAAGMGAMYQQSIMAAQSRAAFEEQTRFLRAGSLEQGIGTLGNIVNEDGRNVAYHGYNARQSASQRLQLLRAAGGRAENLAPMIGTEKAFQAMSNRLRNPVENLIGAAGVLRGGGLGVEDSIKVLQRIQITLENIEGLSTQTPEYLRTSSIYLESIQQLAQQQLAVSGTLSQAQMGAFQGVVSQLKTGAGFDPTQSSAIANILQQRTISPGGGAAGEIFQMRAFGFANANLGAYRKTAQARGIDPSIFKRRGLFEYRAFMENAPLSEKLQATLVGLETEYGNQRDPMAYVLGTSLMPELGQTRARRLVEMYQRGGLSTAQIEKFFEKPTMPSGKRETALDVALGGTEEQTATFMKFKSVNDEYLDSILEFGGQGGLDSLASLNTILRDFQKTLANIVANGAGLKSITEMLKFASQVSGTLVLTPQNRTVEQPYIPRDPTGTRRVDSGRK